MNLRVLAFSLMIGAGLLSAQASAQSYPDRPVRLIAAFPAGGGVDTVARLIAQPLSARLGQPVVVENRTGAAGMLASAVVAKAPADGYTVLVTSNPSVTIAAASDDPKRGYDPLRDLKPVAKATTAASVITVSAAGGFPSLAAMLDKVKARPGEVGFATAGQGSTQHLEMEILKDRLGIDMIHIPYRGTTLFMTDVLSGQVPVGVPATPAASPFIQSGKLVPLAVLSPRRSSILPNVATVRELTGVDFDGIPSWFGFLVPAGTPEPVVQRLEREILAILKDPELLPKLAPLGMDVVAEGSAQFARSNEAETRLIRQTLERSGITTQQ